MPLSGRLHTCFARGQADSLLFGIVAVQFEAIGTPGVFGSSCQWRVRWGETFAGSLIEPFLAAMVIAQATIASGATLSLP